MPKPTFYAKKLEGLLKKLGIKVNEEVWDGYKTVDLSIPNSKLDIEVDGLHHLTDPNQIIKDFKRSSYSREDGYETIHVHNIDLKEEGDKIAEAIAKVSEKREEAIDIMANIQTEKNN